MATTIFTDYGQQLITEAIANKTTINITKIGVGDGMGAVYTPVSSQTALKRETWSGPIDSVQVNPTNKNQVTFEGIVGANVGGFYIREIGLYDQANKLVAISDFPESFKALADQYELYVRMILQTGSADVTNIIVSKDMIYATKKYVDTETAKKYSKPTSGIPKTDLTAAVQTSLEKADNAAPTTELAKTNQALTTHQSDNTAHGIGDKSTLKTTDKTTIVGAVNELFINVSDGKRNIGTAITDVDSKLVVPTNPTFLELSTLIRSISTGAPTKTLWNSGVSNYRKYYQISKDAVYYCDNNINYAKKQNGEDITVVINGSRGTVIGLYEDYYVTFENSTNVSTGATLRFYSTAGAILFSFTVPYNSTSPLTRSSACCKIGDRILYIDLTDDTSRGNRLYIYSLTGTLISTLRNTEVFRYGLVQGFLLSSKKNKAILYNLTGSTVTCSIRELSVNSEGDFVEKYTEYPDTDIISAVMRLFYYYYS